MARVVDASGSRLYRRPSRDRRRPVTVATTWVFALALVPAVIVSAGPGSAGAASAAPNPARAAPNPAIGMPGPARGMPNLASALPGPADAVRVTSTGALRALPGWALPGRGLPGGPFRPTPGMPTLPWLVPRGTAPAVPGPAGSAWSVQPTPNHLAPQGDLYAEDCTSPTSCIAVGHGTNRLSEEATLAEAWNGTTWAIQATPAPPRSLGSALFGVSCTSATACIAVGASANSAGADVTLAEAWNGTTWSIQPTPNPTDATGSTLYSISCSSATACIAVGTYEVSGGTDLTLAEVWNGTTWTVQPTLNRPAKHSALFGVSCTSAAACIAVGLSGEAPLAERWNGTAWTMQHTNNSQYGGLEAVSCTSPDACTAVGFSPNTGSESGTLAEGWNGRTWTIQPAPSTNEAALEGVSCTSPDVCAAVGQYFSPSANIAVPLAEAWNGSSWVLQNAPAPPQAPVISNLAAVSCASPDACTAVGEYQNSGEIYEAFAEDWAPSGWVLRATPNPAGATWGFFNDSSCTSARACTAVGYYQNTYTCAVCGGTLAERWNGTSWAVQQAANQPGAMFSDLYGVSCTSPAACMAVGYYELPDYALGALAEVWNGATWKLVPVPKAAATLLFAVSCTSPGACTAVGLRAGARAGSLLTLAEVWNGKAWAIQHTPDPPPSPHPAYDELTGVSCSSPSACTAVGWYFTASGVEQTALAERWNGTAWALQQVPDPAHALSTIPIGVSCPTASDCTAVGSYDTAGQHYSTFDWTLAERWNGTSWAIQATPKPAGNGRTLVGVSCVSPGNCTAVGYYRNTSKVFVPLADAWNGKTWAVQPTPLPAGSTGGVLQGVSCASPTACTAAGFYFTAAGNTLTLAEARRA
jgi:hypothetical protein